MLVLSCTAIPTKDQEFHVQKSCRDWKKEKRREEEEEEKKNAYN